ncbi:hypothetical protein SynPROS91_01964 [Synechococcus sp. PROS-9-1]|nr:hypothetical protein SynPROS91_01964 [Synechococcus sp. PROS-9-1]
MVLTSDHGVWIVSEGRCTLVSVSDDNFSLILGNLLDLLAPRRSPGCRSLPEN